MAKRTVLVIPDGQAFRSKSGWQKRGRDTYVAIRQFLLVLETRSDDFKTGPAFSTFKWPAGAKLNLEKKRIRTTTSTTELTVAIASTVSSKLSHDVVSSLSASAKVSGASLDSAISEKLATEFTETLQTSVTGTTTFEVAETEEDTQTFEQIVPSEPVPETIVTKYFMLSPVHWDIFLVHTEVLSLRWKRNLAGAKVRDNITHSPTDVRVPLARVTFYQPHPDYAVQYGPYTPQISRDELTHVTAPVVSPPKQVTLPSVSDLAADAKHAFQTTPEWAVNVIRRAVRPSAQKRPAQKRPVARHSAAKRHGLLRKAAAAKLTSDHYKRSPSAKSASHKVSSSKRSKPTRASSKGRKSASRK